VLLVAGGVSACDTALLDLGANVADAGPAAPTLASEDAGGLATSTLGCADWFTDDVLAARATECGGTCSPSAQPPTEASHVPFPTKKRFVELTGGPWTLCSGAFGPSGTVGVEIAPGCRIYFLQYDERGQLTRGTEAHHAGVFGIRDPATNPLVRRIEVTVPGAGAVSYDVSIQTCPRALVLTPVGAPPPADERIVLQRAVERDGGPVGTFP